MIAKLLFHNLILVIVIGGLLFVSAGTLSWPAAWALMATFAVLSPACGLWLARTDPALVAERLQANGQEAQPGADRRLVHVFRLAVLIWLLVIGLDHRMLASDIDATLQVLGFAMLLFSFGLILWVMRENTFATPVVKLQPERGHHVVTTGPYALVRHPMYSGLVLFFIGVSLMLGSWWGAAMSPLFVVLFAVRAGIEERTLIVGLPDYAEYTMKVRYRLLPGFW